MRLPNYHLSPDIFLCPVDDQVVVLDLRRDKYLSLDSSASHLLLPYMDALRFGEGISRPVPNDRLCEVLSRLHINGLLSTDEKAVASSTTRCCIRPERAITPRPPFSGRIRPQHIALYLISAATAATALRIRTIYKVVLAERRKARVRAAAAGKFDLSLATALCSVYAQLRVISVNPRQCLFDSLSQKLFFARYGLFPDWVFGVQINPFSAHCWLQHDSVVLNESIDVVRRYSPIMTV